VERKEVVTRIGIGARVLIIRPRRADGLVKMCLQVRRRRWGWRTCATVHPSPSKAPRFLAEVWLKDYEADPKRFRRGKRSS
jgi:hypothetical protein